MWRHDSVLWSAAFVAVSYFDFGAFSLGDFDFHEVGF